MVLGSAISKLCEEKAYAGKHESLTEGFLTGGWRLMLSKRCYIFEIIIIVSQLLWILINSLKNKYVQVMYILRTYHISIMIMKPAFHLIQFSMFWILKHDLEMLFLSVNDVSRVF